MALTRRPKTGRLASKQERSAAEWWVNLHKAAIAAGGKLVLNPEDPYEQQVSYDVASEPLLRCMEAFVRDGTFQNTMDLRPLLANAIAKRTDLKYEAKVLKVVEELGVTERTAQRLISGKKAKKP